MARQRKTKGTLTRRAVLKRGAALTGAAAASGAITGFPMVWAQNIKDVTLRQFGTGVSNINVIAEKAKEDLGITLQMTALDTDSTAQRVVTQPKSFDIADIEYFTLKKVWGAGNMQPMDISRLQGFDKIVGIFKDGRLTPTSKIAQGTAPHTVSFVEKPGDKKFAAGMTNWYTMVPTIYNADTLGIRPDLINRPIESWTELLNPEFRGKASILNIASIGIMDAAMVCEAMGEIQYGDKGNMTQEEIDKTMAIFTEAKKAGQFRAFWKTFDESVNLMASGEVVIQSMWSPAITKVRSMGIPCVYQPLKEGYRSWGGGLGISANLRGWSWTRPTSTSTGTSPDGSADCSCARATTPRRPRPRRRTCPRTSGATGSKGKPAQGDIINPFGQKMESAGAVRDGGSFHDRMGAVECWNSVMDENRYMVRKWNEFIAA